MKLEFAKPRVNKRSGKIGSHVFVEDDAHGRKARYEFNTVGLKPKEVAEKIEKLRERHRKWSECQDRFADLVGLEFAVAGVTYRIGCCTIPSGGPYEHGTLIVGASEIDGASVRRVDGSPWKMPFLKIDDVPSNEVILEGVRARIEEIASRRNAHETYTSTVRRMISGD